MHQRKGSRRQTGQGLPLGWQPAVCGDSACRPVTSPATVWATAPVGNLLSLLAQLPTRMLLVPRM